MDSIALYLIFPLQVIICNGSKEDIHIVPLSLFPLLDALTSGDIHKVGSLVSKISDLQELFQEVVFDTIKDEIKTLAAREDPSILRDHDNIRNLTFGNVVNEWQQKAPTFLKALEAVASNPLHRFNKYKKDQALIPGIVTAGCKLLTVYSKDLNVFQHLTSFILWKGGCKKSVFTRLNTSYDCLSYQATLNLVDKLGIAWDKDIIDTKELITTETSHELVLLQNVKSIKDSLDLIDGDPEAMVQRILELSHAETDLHQFRDLMDPGFYFIGDNVDMRTKVRNMTMLNQHKDHHMYQICAYENRISGNHLDNTVPKGDASTIPFSTFIPNQVDLDIVAGEFAHLVAHIWCQHMPYFKQFAFTLPDYIEHPYMKDMTQKSRRINMGVLNNSEQYNEDMTDNCEFMHKYVPGHNETDDWTKQPEKILSGGDYLTFERHKQAQSSKRNGRTPTRRLEGLVPKMEEFHNQGELLKVIWKLLYSTSSARDQGTLFAARNTINARNATMDPADDFYAASDLVDKVTVAYIVTGGLVHFGMDSFETSPSKEKYEGEVGDTLEMKSYMIQNAKKFVQEFAIPDVPQLPEYGPQCNTYKCRYCGKRYKQAKSLRKHESSVHGHLDPLYVKEGISQNTTNSKTADSDGINAYTKLILALGLIRLDHNDAIHMGDGDRIMRINQYLILYYEHCHCTKYAFGMLETAAQAKVLLTERKAHQLIWNRTVNHRGEANSNHLNDLDLEHCNKVFKDAAHSHRGVFTEKVVSRVSRTAMKVHGIVKNFDKMCDVYLPSGRHKTADKENDIVALVRQFQTCNLYDYIPGRSHHAYPNMTPNPLFELNMELVRDWIGASLKKFQSKHFH